MRQHGRFIAAVVVAVNNAGARQQLEPVLENRVKNGWVNLVAAIRLVLDGERDENALCESLNYEEAPIMNAILRGIADPDTLNELLAGEG